MVSILYNYTTMNVSKHNASLVFMPFRKLDFICQHCQKTRLFTTASGPSICITPSDLLLSFKLKQTQHLKFGLLWGSWARQCHIESAVCDRLHLLRRSEASSLRIRTAVLRWTNMMAGCRRLCLSSSWPKRLGVVDFGGQHQTQTRNSKVSCTDPGRVLEVLYS